MLGIPVEAFGVVGAIAAIALPLLIILIFAIMLTASLMHSGAKVRESAKASYCYVLQAVGIFLLSCGAIPAIHGVLSLQPYESKVYLALLILFTTGGLTFLWHDALASSVDATSRAVPAAIFWYTIKLIGYVMTLLSALSLLTTMLVPVDLTADWWVMPFILLCYGLLLSWCTHETPTGPFAPASLAKPPNRPAQPLIVAKKGGKKR